MENNNNTNENNKTSIIDVEFILSKSKKRINTLRSCNEIICPNLLAFLLNNFVKNTRRSAAIPAFICLVFEQNICASFSQFISSPSLILLPAKQIN